MARAAELVQQIPPGDAVDVLSLLGDQGNQRYPIYGTDRSPDRSATLCTGLFDLDARWLRIYSSRPGQDPAEFVQFAIG